MPMCMPCLAEAWSYCQDRVTKARADLAPRFEDEAYQRHLALMERARQEQDTAQAAARAELVEVDAPDSVVYYIRFADRIKIGFSRNLGARLTAIPHDELLTVEPGGRGVERLRHRQFAEHRIIGEWFAAASDLLAHIDGLKAKYAEREEWQVAARAAFDAIDPLTNSPSDERVLAILVSEV